MWNDIIIGNGDSGSSAVRVGGYDGPVSVSENSVSYWISDCFIGIGMTIFKDTDEGKALAVMLGKKFNTPDVDITRYLEAIALDRINPGTLRVKIDEALKGAYKRGDEDRAYAIRKALGITGRL